MTPAEYADALAAAKRQVEAARTRLTAAYTSLERGVEARLAQKAAGAECRVAVQRLKELTKAWKGASHK